MCAGETLPADPVRQRRFLLPEYELDRDVEDRHPGDEADARHAGKGQKVRNGKDDQQEAEAAFVQDLEHLAERHLVLGPADGEAMQRLRCRLTTAVPGCGGWWIIRHDTVQGSSLDQQVSKLRIPAANGVVMELE